MSNNLNKYRVFIGGSILLILIGLSTTIMTISSKTIAITPSSSSRMYVDKYNIEKDYLFNIEALRLKALYSRDSIVNSQYAMYSVYNKLIGFNRYTIDWTKMPVYKKDNLPILENSITKIVEATVDTLIYNSDSLLCAALMIVKYPDINKNVIYNSYDGYLLLGCRKDINSKFDIHVYPKIVLLNQVSKEGMSKDLRDTYSNKRADLKYSIFDKRFFSIRMLFDKTKEGDFNFQHNITSWNSIGRKQLLYSNDKERDFYLSEDTVFIPYRIICQSF